MLLKATLFILKILICTTSFGQKNKLIGTWITADQDLILINDTTTSGNYLSNKLFSDENFNLSISHNTLSFQKRYYSSNTDYKKLYIDRYDLKIISNNDTILLLKPVSTFSKKFFQNRQILKFIKQEYFSDKTINFEKIIYHTTKCNGNCPIIDLEIDNKKNVYLNCEFYKAFSMYERDSIKSGQFIGQLNDSLYKELIHLLQTCNLKTLKFGEINGSDAPVTTLIIYYNKQRKQLQSMFPPTIVNKLIIYLYQLNLKAALIRTYELRKLEE